METRRILFIGAGRMAQAMIHGLVKQQGSFAWQIVASNRSDTSRLEALRSRFGIESTSNWQQVVESADVVVLAMPPSEHPAVLAQLRDHVKQHQLIVSVAAGIGVSGLESSLPPDVAVAWVMPNTAASIGQSMTLCALGSAVTNEQVEMLTEMLQALGQHQICTEEQVHKLTAITGSAPAFIYRAAQAFEEMAVEYGLSEVNARQIVGQMLLGSANLLLTGTEPQVLANEVTTPGGATAAGLEVLERGNFMSILQEAITATNQRAAELGMGNPPKR
ncbi:pyrroline-5-carboxylate reductase [Alicyclobacillus dauci]|uniref:Pyrroline-5-carboxylate reductase n=1 Tax=Alicyclobacillus dauci TaxID=1475485 RepID=A0ABY6Z187_9BACL|nr:pyrroline-5-carboxylate reductase [Alicyclobacillus dauci]WAH36089.1 pyrroline-5-carboxylate reductase [Alicyclobacillus dauci]